MYSFLSQWEKRIRNHWYIPVRQKYALTVFPRSCINSFKLLCIPSSRNCQPQKCWNGLWGSGLRMGCSACPEWDSVTVVGRLSPGPKQKQECPLLPWFSVPCLGLGGPCPYVCELLRVRHSGPWTGLTPAGSCIELQACLLLWTPFVQKSASKRSLHLGRKDRPGYAGGEVACCDTAGQGGTLRNPDGSQGIPWCFLKENNLTFQNDIGELIYKIGRDSQT